MPGSFVIIYLFCHDTIIHIRTVLIASSKHLMYYRTYCIIPLLMSTSCMVTAGGTWALLHHWRIRSRALPNIPELVGEVRRRSTVPRGVGAASVGKQWRHCRRTEGLTGAWSNRNRRACLGGKTKTNIKRQYAKYSLIKMKVNGYRKR